MAVSLAFTGSIQHSLLVPYWIGKDLLTPPHITLTTCITFYVFVGCKHRKRKISAEFIHYKTLYN